jgi:uncharacterized protein (TIGR02266 family)
MTITTEAQTPACQPGGAERRQSPRVALCVEVGFQSDSNFYAGFTEDISEGGLFVATHMLQQVGTEVSLTFTLPNDYELRVTGVVRWLRDPHDLDGDTRPGMGLQLRGLSQEDQAMIREFLALRDPLFHDLD